MQARRAARELALILLFESSQGRLSKARSDALIPQGSETLCQLPPRSEIEAMLVDAVRSLRQIAEEQLEQSAQALSTLRDALYEHVISHPDNAESPVEAKLLPVALPTTSELFEQLETAMAGLNQLGHALDVPELAALSQTKDVQQYAIQLVQLALKNEAALDEKISSHSESWRIDRLNVMDRTLLRLALAEIEFIADVDTAVTVNEVVELAKLYA
ncbi:MAG: transcription antitermination factor NusB, partial [Vampirovibrionales bacterium]|nr:transcription antitermination factor NusB [Vampirovibrionales bacterium]